MFTTYILYNLFILEKLNDLLDNFPRWSGDWSIHFVDRGAVEVENSYYDEQCETYESNSEIFIINFTQDELEEFEGVDL